MANICAQQKDHSRYKIDIIHNIYFRIRHMCIFCITMDPDIASAMLLALTSDINSNIPGSLCSIDEQKKFLITNSDKLSREDKIDIGNILKANGKKDLMKETATGIHIDLDKITDADIIRQMYVSMNYKLKKIS